MKLPGWLSGEIARRLLIIPPVAIGVIVFVLFYMNRQSPIKNPVKEESRTLRVIKVSPVDVVPSVIGHGTAEPGEIWRAIAEVKGRVVFVNDKLEPGTLINAKDVLLRIDPTEYELTVAQLESDIQQANAQLAELDVRSDNYQASLKIERESLALAQQDLARIEVLSQTDAVSDSELNKKQREVLTQQQSLQNLENSINLIPAEKKSLQAALAVKQTNLKQANIDLEKTTISAPFDCRLADVSIEIGQFLTSGQQLFEAHGTAVTEVEAQVAPHEAKRLVDPENMALITEWITNPNTSSDFWPSATIRLESGNESAEWEGRVDRLREQLDSQTRSLRIVVAVDKPYEKIIPGQRPPLVRGMYCQVKFEGTVRKNRIVVPRSAVHNGSSLSDGKVYVLDSDNRMRSKDVVIEFSQGDFVCLTSGLNEGDTLVVSDPSPALEGMLVEPVNDDQMLKALIQEATGKGTNQ